MRRGITLKVKPGVCEEIVCLGKEKRRFVQERKGGEGRVGAGERGWLEKRGHEGAMPGESLKTGERSNVGEQVEREIEALDLAQLVSEDGNVGQIPDSRRLCQFICSSWFWTGRRAGFFRDRVGREDEDVDGGDDDRLLRLSSATSESGPSSPLSLTAWRKGCHVREQGKG